MISPSEGPNEQLSEDGRWRWDGERWHPVPDRDRPPARRPEPLWPAAAGEERPAPPAAGPLDASAFTGERMLKGRAGTPPRGWRPPGDMGRGGGAQPPP